MAPDRSSSECRAALPAIQRGCRMMADRQPHTPRPVQIVCRDRHDEHTCVAREQAREDPRRAGWLDRRSGAGGTLETGWHLGEGQSFQGGSMSTISAALAVLRLRPINALVNDTDRRSS